MGKQVCWKNWSQKYPFICFSHVIVAAGPLSAIDGALSSSSSSHQVLDNTVIGKRIFGSRRMPISCPWWVGEQKIRSFFFSSPYFSLKRGIRNKNFQKGVGKENSMRGWKRKCPKRGWKRKFEQGVGEEFPKRGWKRKFNEGLEKKISNELS